MSTGRPFHILLVEDSPTDRLIAVQALKSASVQTTLHFVEDGVDALAYLRAGADPAKVRPDLILLDLNLPRMDGRAVLEALKSDADLRLIPVVVLTTSNAREDVRGAYALHANSYMTKAVDFCQFARSLSDLVNYWCEVVTLPTR